MDTQVLWRSVFFLLCIVFCPGFAEKPSPAATRGSRGTGNQENRVLITTSEPTTTQPAGNVPIVTPNPTAPGPPLTPFPTTPGPPTTPFPTTPAPPTPAMTGTQPPPSTSLPTTPPSTPSTPSSGSWCVAKQNAASKDLQVALDFACGYGRADCSKIQPGQSCYGQTIQERASYAFNDYYQKHRDPNSCNFGGTATPVSQDPSSATCKYTEPLTSTSSSVPAAPSGSINPYGTTTPLGSTPPFDTASDGSEPSSTPSSAASVSCNLLVLLLSVASLSLPLHAENSL